jgi:hypothetical protein
LHIAGDLRNALLRVFKYVRIFDARRKLLVMAIQLHGKERQALVYVVVKFSSDPGTFFFVSFNQLASDRGECRFCQFPVRDV